MILFATQLPPGAYAVGDPCYAISGEAWDDALAAHRGQGGGNEFTYCGRKLVFCDAGGASDDEGFDYPVDSATFGIVPLELSTTDREWLFKVEQFKRRDNDEIEVRQRGAVLIESARPVEVQLIAEGRSRTLLVGDKRFELFEA